MGWALEGSHVGSRKLSAVSQDPKELLKHVGGGRARSACSWRVGELQERRFHKEAAANIQARDGGGGAAWVIETDGSNRFLGQTARAW